ncbi:MAG: heme o synthase [Chitinophagales bacterium]|nr:heme o synthase [Chitinophagales bacterium]MBP8754124.1 heme o synthase [Chitinophagales bacterium]MBP9547911.1 heme o synthase [Chitinophagales bacterium]MBP9704869.1 heme o synthase [Chitinophagales bacterium]
MPRSISILSDFTSRVKSKVTDYLLLVKFRLSFIVVFSAGIGYVFAGGDMYYFGLFLLAGFLITAASNALNQIIEVETDKLMGRTANRPLPAGRMQSTEAIIAAGTMGISGIVLMWILFNPISALLGALSLLSYAFIYTPIKRISPLAVFVGAFPGAVPPLIGWAAATGSIGEMAIILFVIQFMWQFPHFWAIAWVAFDDYKRAGFQLLPTVSGQSKASAFHVLMYTIFLIPISLIPFLSGFTGSVSAIIIALTGLGFLYQAIQLYKSCDVKSARKLMFGSFLYLPIVLIALFFDRI